MNAFSNGGVYSCNTATSSLFEDFPFHPDKLLQDFINIIHPELSQEATTYYKPVK
jgi:iron complex transport system substrate-binding protein